MVKPSSADSEWRSGWRIATSAMLGYGTGNAMVLITAGLFIRPMRIALGWPTSAVTLAPVMSLVWALASPLSGVAIGRFGPRRCAIAGHLLLGCCLIALAVSPSVYFVLLVLAAAIGLISPLTNVPTYASGLARWFERHAGAAFGIAFNGSALVGLMAVPLVSFAITRFGWRAGYTVLAVMVLGLGLPALAGWFKDKPTASAAPTAKPGQLDEIVTNPRIWLFLAIFLIGSIPLGGFMGHLQPMLAESRVPIVTATILGMAYSASVCAGRILGGLLLDRFWPFAVAGGMFFLAALGGYGLAISTHGATLPLMTTVVLLVGMGQGAEADFLAFFALRCFSAEIYPLILGGNVAASCLGIAAGGYGFAVLFDRFGNYQMACLIGSASFAIAAILIVIAGHLDRHSLINFGTATDPI